MQDGVLVRKRVSYYLGDAVGRGRRPPDDIQKAAKDHMASVTSGVVPAERIVTIKDFAEAVFLPWSEEHKRPSTFKSYADIWSRHVKPLCGEFWLKDTKCHHVQSWLDRIGKGGLSRNTLKHIKSMVSGMFRLAKQQNYFDGINPAHDTAINPEAAEPVETYAYSLEEVQAILTLLPEPAATAFAVAAFAGLRLGEIQALEWPDYHDGEIFISRSIWNGRIGKPKTKKSCAPVPTIKPLADRLEMYRLHCGNPTTGPIFPNAKGRPRALSSILFRIILPALNRCAVCRKAERDHKTDHPYRRDDHLPEWHGWHAARRGLGSNLYRLEVPELVIQRILRHANVSTTMGYYIKTAADDVRDAMTKLENDVQAQDTIGHQNAVEPSTVQ
jgi:integrase